MRALAKWEEVPIFDSEEAEAGFWAKNKPDLRLMEGAVAAPTEGAGSVTITLRIDARMLARIKRMAQSRYLNHQSMIRQRLSERLEQELWQCCVMLGETQNQFSLARAALSTRGAQKSKFPSVTEKNYES